MVCTKCGKQNGDNAVFCGSCGTNLGVNSLMCQKGQSSDISDKKAKKLKVLGKISLALQTTVCAAGLLFWWYLGLSLVGNLMYEGEGPFVSLIMVFLLTITAFSIVPLFLSYFFTIKGLKKKSKRFLIASSVASFWTTIFSASLVGPTLFSLLFSPGIESMLFSLLFACAILGIHIVLIVLNNKNFLKI